MDMSGCECKPDRAQPSIKRRTSMTDVDLKRNVEAELNWEPSLKNPASIGVRVKDGIVTLTGQVETYAEKLAAERAAARVSGVKAVANELEVQLAKSGERTDEDIARAAANALDWTSGIPRDQIKVTVDKGWITLKGAVDWEYQRAAAEDAVKHLEGVKGIINLIEVRPSASKTVLKKSIEEALKRHAEIEAQRIHVEVIGSKVILRGTVYSWFEKQEAERVAWQAPGVTHVENQITVAAAA
jgi:osmotically-inducible protein OsmY